MFVLCEGNVARKPYIMPYTNQKIYSLEELCYYLYHNIYTLTEDFFQPALADWLREETNHEKLANKVNKMMSENPTLKDMVVTILCGCDYYRENEIREIIKVMDGIAGSQKKENESGQLSAFRALCQKSCGIPQIIAWQFFNEFYTGGIRGFAAQSRDCPFLCIFFC